MCIAIPGEIKDIVNTKAKVNMMGVESTVNIQLIDNPKVGDYVLIHAGCAIEKVDETYYNELFNIFKDMIDKNERKYE